ncbi:hypothetical protein niasHT_008754 [Heterodera trifolii]|uniref:Uncharacterized protein n=1 Tax=Heterodera trifolii TaxID=157864 RepID=A0ABD2M280_9BILA
MAHFLAKFALALFFILSEVTKGNGQNGYHNLMYYNPQQQQNAPLLSSLQQCQQQLNDLQQQIVSMQNQKTPAANSPSGNGTQTQQGTDSAKNLLEGVVVANSSTKFVKSAFT